MSARFSISSSEQVQPGFLASLLGVAAAVAAALLGFVLLVDPYGVSPVGLRVPGFNEFKPARIDIDRVIKPIEVWQRKPRTVFLGTSRIHQSLEPATLAGSEFAPAYNAAVPAGSVAENGQLLDLYLRLNGEIRHVYLEIFQSAFTRAQLAGEPLPVTGVIRSFAGLTASFGAVRDAVTTIRYNRSSAPARAATVAPSGRWLPPSGLSTASTFAENRFISNMLAIHAAGYSFSIQPSAMAALERIVELCRRRGVTLHLLFTPNYPWDDYQFMSAGHQGLMEDLLRRLSRYENVYSFLDYDEATTEPAGEGMRWWYDPLHFSKATGDLILRGVLDRNAAARPRLFERVTPASVEGLIARRRADLERWAQANLHFPIRFESAKLALPTPLKAEPPDYVQAFIDQARQERSAQAGERERRGAVLRSAAVGGQGLSLDGVEYTYHPVFGGSLEGVESTRSAMRITGWAADSQGNRPVLRIVASAGGRLLAEAVPTDRRVDIEQGVASGANPAGFTLDLPREVGGGGPIRVYALTHDRRAIRLNSNIAAQAGGLVENYQPPPPGRTGSGAPPAQ